MAVCDSKGSECIWDISILTVGCARMNLGMDPQYWSILHGYLHAINALGKENMHKRVT